MISAQIFLERQRRKTLWITNSKCTAQCSFFTKSATRCLMAPQTCIWIAGHHPRSSFWHLSLPENKYKSRSRASLTYSSSNLHFKGQTEISHMSMKSTFRLQSRSLCESPGWGRRPNSFTFVFLLKVSLQNWKGTRGFPNSQEKILHSSNTSKATCKGRMCHTAYGTDENEQKWSVIWMKVEAEEVGSSLSLESFKY